MGVPLARRELRARPARAALLGATVVVAVAFCAAAVGFAGQVRALVVPPGVDTTVPLPEGSVVLTADTSSLTTPTALDDRLLATVRAVQGVARADADYDQPLSFVVPAGTQTERPPVLRGVVLSSTADPSRWRAVAGRLPASPFEVAVDAGGAAVGATGLGLNAQLQVPIGTLPVEVVGIVEPVGADRSVPAAVRSGELGAAAVALASAHVVLDATSAPVLLDAVGRADRITVLPLPGTDPDVLARRLQRAVPGGIDVVASTNRAARTQHTVASIDDDVKSATLAYAGLTVLVATLVIANSASVLVAQRVRELGLLRAVGASRAQVTRALLGESLLLGILGSAVGIVAGAALAYVAGRVVRTGDVPVHLTITGAMASTGLAVGVATSLAGALWPAVRAGRVPPLAALSDTRAGADRRSGGLLPLVLVPAGFGMAAWAALGAAALTTARLVVVGAGALVGFTGLALASRWVVVPVASIVGPPVARLAGVTARLGIGNVRRQPSRTAGAASTLMVGLALVGTVATFGASAHRSIDAQVGTSGRADVYVERRGVVRVSTTAVDRVLHREWGVVDAAELASLDGQLVGPDGATSDALVADPAAVHRIVDLGLTRGAVADGADDGALVSVDTADRLGVGVGDRLVVRSTSGRSAPVRIVALYANTAIAGSAVVPADLARRLDADGTFEVAAVRLDPDAPIGWVTRRLERAMRTFPKVAVDTPAGFAHLSSSVTDATVRVISVLLAGALGIGLLGLASTLALATVERRRELVLLRAVGAAPLQVRGLVWLEATLVGVIAALVGLGSGTIAGRLGVGLAPGSLGASPVVPWAQVLGVAAVAIVLAWAVSLGVARRAARVPPAEAGRVGT